MPKTYDPAPPDVREIFDRVFAEHFSVLAELKPPLLFDLQMVSNKDKDGNPVIALKKNRHPVAGMIKRVPDDEKSKGSADLRIFMDQMLWDSYSTREREALLFHELCHVEPKFDRYGILKLDQYGRIAIRLKPDDWMLTGFKATVQVYGQDAIERQSLDRVMKSLEQKTLPFGDEATADDEPASVAFPVGKRTGRQPAATAQA